jgi:hypothetical protein
LREKLMQASAREFEYVELQSMAWKSEDFVISVPTGIHSEMVLLDTLAEAGCFPGYFGRNWDALRDCFLDLSWIPQTQVVIVHGDLPLCTDNLRCKIYLETLHDALVAWSLPPRVNTVPIADDWPFVQHSFRVVFPLEVKAATMACLSE